MTAGLRRARTQPEKRLPNRDPKPYRVLAGRRHSDQRLRVACERAADAPASVVDVPGTRYCPTILMGMGGRPSAVGREYPASAGHSPLEGATNESPGSGMHQALRPEPEAAGAASYSPTLNPIPESRGNPTDPARTNLSHQVKGLQTPGAVLYLSSCHSASGGKI